MSSPRPQRIKIDAAVYEQALELLSEQHLVNALAGPEDYQIYLDDTWLLDSAVSEELVKRDGMWRIHLIFLNPRQPLQFCRRFIVSQVQEAKARLMANFMRRLAAKDQRGTITVPDKRYVWNTN